MAGTVAAKEGHLNVVRLLLDHGAKIDHINKVGASALYLAASQEGSSGYCGPSDYLAVVNLLLERGAQVGLPKNDGSTALNAASGGGHIDVAAALRKYEASIVDEVQ